MEDSASRAGGHSHTYTPGSRFLLLLLHFATRTRTLRVKEGPKCGPAPTGPTPHSFAACLLR